MRKFREHLNESRMINESDDYNHKDYNVGKKYAYSQIPEFSTEEYEVSDYGQEYLGQNAVHVRFHKDETDVWFIFDSNSTSSMLCVYNR